MYEDDLQLGELKGNCLLLKLYWGSETFFWVCDKAWVANSFPIFRSVPYNLNEGQYNGGLPKRIIHKWKWVKNTHKWKLIQGYCRVSVDNKKETLFKEDKNAEKSR